MSTGLQSQITSLNRLSEQEEEDDDVDGDYDDDIEEGCEDDVMDNVSKNTASPSFACYSGMGNSKLKNAYPYRATDAPSPAHCDSLRKRNVATSITDPNTKAKTTKSKCVQFMPSAKFNDDNDDDDDDDDHSSRHSAARLSAQLNVRSKPMKKIVFNGTFPIDDPYSSRF